MIEPLQQRKRIHNQPSYRMYHDEEMLYNMTMKVGTRILYPEEVGIWDAELFQISVYRGMDGNLEMMKACAGACRDAGIPYVIHPVSYSLLQDEGIKFIKEMATWTDLAMILHDERTPDGQRLNEQYETSFRSAIEELRHVASISFENATATGDVRWFWENYSDSITLDIGHVESSAYNSVEFVRSLDEATIEKIQFVHIHRNNGLRGGITDHWPLTADCRELKALKELIILKPDVNVILELIEVAEIDDSLQQLRELRSILAA